MTRNLSVRVDVLTFAIDFHRRTGTHPTITEAAKALGIPRKSADNAIQAACIRDLFDIRGRGVASHPPMPDVPQIGLARKARFWRQVVRTLYPDRYGGRS